MGGCIKALMRWTNLRHILIGLLCLGLLAGCQESHAQLMMMSSTPSTDNTNYTADVNCMGAWLMVTTNDSESDVSGEGETLTESAADDMPTSTTVPGSYSGTSRDFTSTDDEVLLHADSGSTDISGANQPMSACCWFKFESTPASNDTLIAKYYVTGDHRQYKLQFRNSDSALCAYVSSDGTLANTTKAIGGTDINDTTWHHGCFVYNDIDLRVYLDGTLDSNGGSNPIAHTAGIADKDAQFGVGNTPDTASEGFDGLIDEVGIFDRALAATEITAIYTYGIDGTKGGND